jgi:hypothetical protein
MFTDIGQEVQHANELLNRLNQWKKWCQVNSIKIYELMEIIFVCLIRLNDGKCRHHNAHG